MVDRTWDFMFCPECGSDYTYLKPDNGSSIRYGGCNKCLNAQWEVTQEQAVFLAEPSLKWRRLQKIDDDAWIEREKLCKNTYVASRSIAPSTLS